MLAAEKNGSWLRVVVKFLLTNQTKDDDPCMQRSLARAPYATSIQSVFSQTMTHACNVNTIERTSGVSNKSKRH